MALRRNVLWNLMGTALPLLAAAVAFPFLNARLGTERFGLLTLLWTLVGYLSLFDLGLGRALTQILARRRDTGDPGPVLKTGLAFTLWAGLAGGLLLFLLAGPLVHRWLNISAAVQGEALGAFQLTSCAVPLATVSAGLRGALEGVERFYEVNLARAVLGLASFLLPMAVVLALGPGLPGLAASLVLGRLLTFGLFLKALGNAYPAFRWSTPAALTQAKALAGFGLWMTLSNLISPVLVYADRFVISSTLGATLVAFYTVPFEIMVRLQLIPGAIGATLFPRLSTMFVRDPDQARSLVNTSLLVTAGVMLAMVGAVLAAYRPLLGRFMGGAFAARTLPIALALGVGAVLNGLASVYYTAVQAKGGARPTGLLHLVELAVYLPLLLVMVRAFGLAGAAWTWVFRVALDGLLLAWMYGRGHPKPQENPS